MRPARARLLLMLLAVLLAAGAAPACTRVVAGTPAAAPADAVLLPPSAASGSVRAGAPVADGARTPAPPSDTGTGAAVGLTALQPDVIADECLLNAAQFAALLGSRVRAPEQSTVRRDDGSHSSSCYAGPAAGSGPMAAINVYRVRVGTPAQFVRDGGGRALRGAGAAAAVLDTAAGPTLQVANARFLVTVVVQGSDPDDAAWRTAARAALARLPSP